MKRIFFPALIGLILLTGCSFPGAATPTPTQAVPAPILFVTTDTPRAPEPTALPQFTPTVTPIPPIASNICIDPQVPALIDSLKRAMLNADGPLLSSLVSPNGMEVRYFRSTKDPIMYTAYQATFLFETTYQADWGAEPGSGQNKKGSFHDVVVPDMKKLFNQVYTLHCNEIRHGGATYDVKWPYNKDFYAIYFPGSSQDAPDWHTWVVGVEYANSKPMIYALVNYFWEP